MRLLSLLEDERIADASWSIIFRQSPKSCLVKTDLRIVLRYAVFGAVPVWMRFWVIRRWL